MRSVAFRVCRLQVLRTRALAPRRQGYSYDYCGSALAPRRQGYNNDKYCALARLPPDGRAAPRRQSYNYEYCALARLPPDGRATIKTNAAHARLPPDDRAAPRRPGLLHCAHTKGPCIRLSYHQIYGETRCKLKVGIREWLLMEFSCQGFLPRVTEQGTEDREDDAPTLSGAIHAIIARAPPRASLERLARCKNGRSHVCLILWRNCSQGDKIWTCSPCVAATIRDTRTAMQTA